MNLLIHTEIPLRENDANLLLGMQAAKIGFNVVIGTRQMLYQLIKKKFIREGIYHTKSITYSESTSKFLKQIKKNKFLISIQDQEHGLLDDNYSNFEKSRIKKKDFQLTDVWFCWGRKDYNYLINSNRYSLNEKKKIICKGSPRIELSKTKFKNLWKIGKKKKNITLITNFCMYNGHLSSDILIAKYKKINFYKKNKKQLHSDLDRLKYEKILINDFSKLVVFLKDNFSKYNIVIRPHPAESLDYWKKKFSNFKNVEIKNYEAINKSIFDSFCIINNSCTSSLEAAYSEVPVINYVPNYYKSKYGFSANKVGIKAKNFYEILKNINKLKNKKFKKIQTLKSKKFVEKNFFYTDNKSYSESREISVYLKKLFLKIFKKNKSKFSSKRIIFYLFFTSLIKDIYSDIILFLKNKRKKIKKLTSYKINDLRKDEIEFKSNEIAKKINFFNYDLKIINKKFIIIENKDPFK